MRREEFLPSDVPDASASGCDGLAALTTALALYLREVDDDHRVCVQHEGTTTVSEDRGCLRLTRLFPRTRQAVASVRTVSGRLPGWQTSPFWHIDGTRWVALERESLRAHAPGARGAVTRGVAWNGRPVLVRARPRGPERLTALELLLPPLTGDLPELPLRTVAEGLRCHAHLLPDRVATPVRLSDVPRPDGITVRAYLQRAMPRGLYAGQCFSGQVEGN
jgi:hypothetical protein